MMATSGTSNMDDLPGELILKILDYIDISSKPNWRQATVFYNLILTNRRFNRLAIPYLYSHWSFSGTHDHTEQFLHNIKAYPSRAPLIKTIHWIYNSGDIRPRRSIRIDHDLLWRVLEALSTTNARQLVAECLEDIPHEVRDGDQQHLSTLLLCTPCVERLEISETYQWDDHVFWFRPLLRAPHALPHLTTAVLQGPMRLENVTALIILPSMRTLDLTEVIELRREPGRHFDWEHQKHTLCSHLRRHGSNVEHFHLRSSYIELSDLQDLFHAFRALKSFTYEHVLHDLSRTAEYGGLAYDTLACLIQHQASTLMNLRVFDEGRYPTRGRLLNLLACIQRFPCLRVLDIAPLRGQSRVDVIPASLEILRVRLQRCAKFETNSARVKTDLAFTTRFLNGVIDKRLRTGELPQLQKVELLDWHPWYGVYPDWETQTKREVMGVVFVSRPAAISGDKDLGWKEDVEDDWVYVQMEQMG